MSRKTLIYSLPMIYADVGMDTISTERSVFN